MCKDSIVTIPSHNRTYGGKLLTLSGIRDFFGICGEDHRNPNEDREDKTWSHLANERVAQGSGEFAPPSRVGILPAQMEE